jgi:RHS repeat-associated core domain
MGRFMSPDPMGGHPDDPQSLNKYAYVDNNPLSLTDPTGLDFHLSCTAAKDGSNASTCQGGQVGTTDSNGKFTPTVITSDSLRDPNSGNSATVNGSGVQITTGGQTYSGQYFENSASDAQHSGDGTDHNPIDIDGKVGNLSLTFHVDGNCNGNCNASGYAMFNGTPDQARAALNNAGAQQTWLDKMYFEGHSGDEWLFHWDTTAARFNLSGSTSLAFDVQRQNAVLGVPSRTQMQFHVNAHTGLGHMMDAAKALFDPSQDR